MVLSYAPSEETFASIATRRSIVLACSLVPTYQAGPVVSIVCTIRAKQETVKQLTCDYFECAWCNKHDLQAIIVVYYRFCSSSRPASHHSKACRSLTTTRVDFIPREHCVPKRNPLRYIYSQWNCTLNSTGLRLSLEKIRLLMAATHRSRLIINEGWFLGCHVTPMPSTRWMRDVDFDPILTEVNLKTKQFFRFRKKIVLPRNHIFITSKCLTPFCLCTLRDNPFASRAGGLRKVLEKTTKTQL